MEPKTVEMRSIEIIRKGKRDCGNEVFDGAEAAMRAVVHGTAWLATSEEGERMIVGPSSEEYLRSAWALGEGAEVRRIVCVSIKAACYKCPCRVEMPHELQDMIDRGVDPDRDPDDCECCFGYKVETWRAEDGTPLHVSPDCNLGEVIMQDKEEGFMPEVIDLWDFDLDGESEAKLRGGYEGAKGAQEQRATAVLKALLFALEEKVTLKAFKHMQRLKELIDDAGAFPDVTSHSQGLGKHDEEEFLFALGEGQS